MQAFLWFLLAWGWAVSTGLLALPNLKHTNGSRSERAWSSGIGKLLDVKVASTWLVNICLVLPRVHISGQQRKNTRWFKLTLIGDLRGLFASYIGRRRIAFGLVSLNMQFALHTVLHLGHRRLCWQTGNGHLPGKRRWIRKPKIVFKWSVLIFTSIITANEGPGLSIERPTGSCLITWHKFERPSCHPKSSMKETWTWIFRGHLGLHPKGTVDHLPCRFACHFGNLDAWSLSNPAPPSTVCVTSRHFSLSSPNFSN